jgi:hypothetical protein
MVRELFIEDEATPEEAVAVEEACARAGFPATIERGLDWPLPGEKPWGVVLTVTVPIPMFFDAFATEGANDPYATVKAWAQEIFEARRGSQSRRGEILIHGGGTTRIALWSDIPEVALDSLAEIDWGDTRDYLTANSPIDPLEAQFVIAASQHRYFHWDAEENEWVDRSKSSPQRKWSKWFLVGVVATGLAGLFRPRRAR